MKDGRRIPMSLEPQIQKNVPTKRAVAEALGWRLFITVGGIFLAILGIIGAIIGGIADALGAGGE